jgi:predicted MFS family arabinose efflux permease
MRTLRHAVGDKAGRTLLASPPDSEISVHGAARAWPKHGGMAGMTSNLVARISAGRLHYAWIALGVTFLASLAAVGVRAAPGVMIVPLQREYGWSVETISGAVSVNIILIGLIGPFMVALMDVIGLKRLMLACLGLLAIGPAASMFMTAPWQMYATWGVIAGIGSAAGALGVSTAIANRWFHTNRGLAMGLLMSAFAGGQLIFLPILAFLSENYGWEAIAFFVTVVVAAALPLVAWLLPEHPADIGLAPYGGQMEREAAPGTANPVTAAFQGLNRGVRSLDFWLLSITLGICGLSTAGLVGTHMVAYCVDRGISEVTAAGFLAMLGVFNLLGSAVSGWLTDRMNPRVLMFWLFGLRGLALFLLPFTSFDYVSLAVFTVFYGLNWVAIVPPQVAIVNEVFGKQAAPVIISWIFVFHQLGGGLAAWGAGAVRDATGSYLMAFILSGLACFLAAVLVLRINRTPKLAAAPA